MLWETLADAVLVIHAAFITFVVCGFGAILLGVARGWGWVRNFSFRLLHLFSIMFVCAEAVTGAMCPLTVLENALRQRAGQSPYPGDFIAYWLRRLIYYNWPPWVFAALYLGFGALVILAFVLAPPRWPRGD
jgi:hypothetical protein